MNRKPATLDSTLLARKGRALPSLFGGVSSPAPAHQLAPMANGLRAQRPAPQPPEPARKPEAVGKGEPGGRIRISVRLEPARHRRLKLLAAHTGRSVQEIMTAALDEQLKRNAGRVMDGRCACLAAGDGTPDKDDRAGPGRAQS